MEFTNVKIDQLNKHVSYTIEDHTTGILAIIPIEFIFNSQDSEYPQCTIKNVIDNIVIYSNIEIENLKYVEAYVYFYDLLWNKSKYYLSELLLFVASFYFKDIIKTFGLDDISTLRTKFYSFNIFISQYLEFVNNLDEDVDVKDI